MKIPSVLTFLSFAQSVLAGRDSPQAILADGSIVQGAMVGKVAGFKGIRYAEPPVGSLRWSPPRPYTGEVAVDASSYGSVCVQPGEGGGSEDCLFLNVFVYGDKLDNVTNANLPVAIYIHGGAYYSGSSNLYNPTEVIEYWEGAAVVVTINYRLGVFGFLGSDELRVQDKDGSTGNYGLQDQRMAMQWVQENIASFGGNPRRVMIYGESAGAGSVTNQLTMPRTVEADLYSSAILESGAFAVWAIQNFTLSQGAYDRMLLAIGCSDLNCMLSKSSTEIFIASEGVSSLDLNYLHPWNPCPDMVEIFTHPWNLLTTGGVKDVPIMMGTNSDEGTMFTKLPKSATKAQLIAHWTREDYSATEQAIMMEMYVTNAEYPDVEGDSQYWWAGERQLGDISMSCPSKNAAVHLTSSEMRKSSVHLYHFEHKTGDADYVPHSAELNYVFHDSFFLQTSADLEMADAVSSYWGNFLIDDSKDPNSKVIGRKSIPYWPAYAATVDASLSLTDTVQDSVVVTGLKRKECELAIAQIEDYVKSSFPPATSV